MQPQYGMCEPAEDRVKGNVAEHGLEVHCEILSLAAIGRAHGQAQRRYFCSRICSSSLYFVQLRRSDRWRFRLGEQGKS